LKENRKKTLNVKEKKKDDQAQKAETLPPHSFRNTLPGHRDSILLTRDRRILSKRECNGWTILAFYCPMEGQKNPKGTPFRLYRLMALDGSAPGPTAAEANVKLVSGTGSPRLIKAGGGTTSNKYHHETEPKT